MAEWDAMYDTNGLLCEKEGRYDVSGFVLSFKTISTGVWDIEAYNNDNMKCHGFVYIDSNGRLWSLAADNEYQEQHQYIYGDNKGHDVARIPIHIFKHFLVKES